MQADDFIKLVDNPNFISGIYNYCNRWCSKCIFVSRCTVGTMEQLMQFGRNAGEPVTLDEITGMMEIATGTNIPTENVHTISINLEDLMQQDDEDSLLNEMPTDDDFNSEFKAAQQFVESHEIILHAHAYTLSYFKWKNKMQQYFYNDSKANNFAFQYIGKFQVTSSEQKKQIEEAFEIVDWYALQIEIKLKRALHGYYTDKDDYAPGEVQTDYNGSAKIAMIGVQETIIALQLLHDFFVDEQAGIINKIGLLEIIRDKTFEQFPYLESFRRPGFEVQ